MADIRYMLYRLKAEGFFQYVVPFLLVLAAFYGLLRLANVFESKRIDGVISLLLAGLVAGYTPFIEGAFGEFLVNLFGNAAILVVLAVVFFMFESSVSGGRDRRYVSSHRGTFGIIVVVALLIFFVASGGIDMLFGSGTFRSTLQGGDVAVFAVVAALLGLIHYMSQRL